jgi:adenosylcobinamide kinase/adenosylcobinamide-phosphate guanylyltransferase
MKIFISGGSKSGKSRYAERIALKLRKNNMPVYYLATMIPVDDEDYARIERHRREREGHGFETIEAGRDFISATEKCDAGGTFLLDSVTALLANEMFDRDSNADLSAYKRVSSYLTDLLNRANNIVIVSDYIYSDAFLYDEVTEAYRRGLAYIDRQIARQSDVVLEINAGICTPHKGAELMGKSIVEIVNEIC